MDWIKVNLDAAVNQVRGHARCGGMLRNYKGEWKGGFVKDVGDAYVLEVEAWVLLEGLKYARL